MRKWLLNARLRPKRKGKPRNESKNDKRKREHRPLL